MQMPELFAAMRPVLSAFRDLEVPHYIGGSVASSAQGVVRATADVDIVADLLPQHVDPFVNRLGNQYYWNRQTILDAVGRHSCFNVIHFETMVKVDIFAAKPRSYDRGAFHRIQYKAMDAEHPQERFPVASPEDIILSKLEWYRLGDEVSENQWRDVTGLIVLHRHALDLPYLQSMAKELRVADLLDRVWEETREISE
jgi:hypothetical protein